MTLDSRVKNTWGQVVKCLNTVAFVWLIIIPITTGDALATERLQTLTAASFSPSLGSLGHTTSLPAPLSRTDAQRYREIFDLLVDDRWDEATARLAAVSNPLLAGRVTATLYLDPAAPKTSYPQLKSWLDSYADLPEAPRIYQLALARLPQGTAPPDKPKLALDPATSAKLASSLDDGDVEPDPTYTPKRKLAAAERIRANAIRRSVDQAVSNGDLDEALTQLANPETASLLETPEIDIAKARIAAQWFYRGEDARAFELATAALARSAQYVPMAHWIAGLSAWRLKHLEQARWHFETLARTDGISPWVASGAAYWAARVHLKARQPQLVSQWLELAAHNERTFYGIMARRALGLDTFYNMDKASAVAGDVGRLLETAAGRRVAALLQINETDLAGDELEAIAITGTPTVAHAALSLARRFALEDTATRISDRMDSADGKPSDAQRYPIPRWQPVDGFKVDKALLYAFIRQESRFNPRARSPAGALGLMQLMPQTAAYAGKGSGLASRDLLEPGVNMALGQRYIRYLYEHEAVQGDLFRMIAAYNTGPGNLIKWQHEGENEDPLLFMETIRAKETRTFIERVLASYWIYRRRLNLDNPTLDAIAAGQWPSYSLTDGTTAIARNVTN
jgi:peptidoglycan lytic transglycosylase